MATPTLLETLPPVHSASYLGDVQVLEQLYGGGWSLTARDSDGRTPLHWAAANGQLETVKWLVQKNSDLLCMQDKDGSTPLHCAAISGQLETIKWLVQKNSDLLCMQDEGCTTPLHCAAVMGHLEVVKWQVERRGDLLFMQDKYGLTPLDCAVLYGRHEVERWLVKKGGGAVTAGPVSVQHVVSNYLCQSVRVCCVVLCWPRHLHLHIITTTLVGHCSDA